MKMIFYAHALKHKKGFTLSFVLKLKVRVFGTRNEARVAQLVSARPSVGEVPSSIRGDIISLFQILSFLCSFDLL